MRTLHLITTLTRTRTQTQTQTQTQTRAHTHAHTHACTFQGQALRENSHESLTSYDDSSLNSSETFQSKHSDSETGSRSHSASHSSVGHDSSRSSTSNHSRNSNRPHPGAADVLPAMDPETSPLLIALDDVAVDGGGEGKGGGGSGGNFSDVPPLPLVNRGGREEKTGDVWRWEDTCGDSIFGSESEFSFGGDFRKGARGNGFVPLQGSSNRLNSFQAPHGGTAGMLI